MNQMISVYGERIKVDFGKNPVSQFFEEFVDFFAPDLGKEIDFPRGKDFGKRYIFKGRSANNAGRKIKITTNISRDISRNPEKNEEKKENWKQQKRW
ncbi:hypothetical protein [Oceanobacillus salinisoli]|uniref:hypothetical protein n=1 Tax=Oceanobacillus salinisoli TaxID=2678611 RepID=UPI0012E29EE7|nr:hypothetical protein [Oceanobacillus salinisoli]